MPSPKDIHKLVQDLHQAKILNADITISDAIKAVSGSAEGLTLRKVGDTVGADAAWYVIGGSGYVLVVPG